MMPHPTTIHAVADLRRKDLLADAARDRRSATVGDHSPPVRLTANVWMVVVSATALLILLGLVAVPGALGAPIHPEMAYTPEEAVNLEVARRFFEEVHDAGDLAVAEEIIAADAVFHIPGGELTGPDGIGGLVTALRTAFPDATFPMEDVVIDNELVAVRWTMRGTSLGEFQGIPPTGEPVELRGTAFLCIEDGRIVEDWVTYDQLGLLQQLGAMPGAEAIATPES